MTEREDAMAMTSVTDGPAAPPRRFNPKVLALAAMLAVLTSPVTAIWFLLIAPLLLVLSAIVAVLTRSSLDLSERALRLGLSVGVGLLVGPAVYIGLALV